MTCILRFVDRLLQTLVPPGQNRICFRSLPDYADNAYYVFRHALQHRSGLDHTWLLVDMSLEPRIRRDFARWTAAAGTTGNRLRIAHRRSVRGYWFHLRSRWVFHTHGIYPIANAALRGRVVVNLWHGMPIKCIARLNRRTPNAYPTFGTVHIATSPFFRYIIATAFRVPVDAVQVCSLPRCDVLRADGAPDASRDHVRAALGIPAGRKMILWMPTYRTERRVGTQAARSFLDDLPAGALQTLERASRAHGCHIVVKLHAFDMLNEGPPPTTSPEVLWLRTQDWARHSVQLYDLIAASDALLSDVSSVLIDYLVTERPAGILGFDPETYTRDLIFPIDYVMHSHRFDVLSSADAIEAFVAKASAARPPDAPDNDVAQIFYQAFPENGSEHILRTVGL